MAFEPCNRHVPFVPLRYDSHDPESSALKLVLTLSPSWQLPGSSVEFIRFTDGITNTLLKAVNRKPGLSQDAIDQDALLLRAYGHGTDLIIDRQREAQNHELLMQYGLAPTLLARFENGMLYRFIRGEVTRPEDIRRPEISMAIARRLAQWHATVPCLPQAITASISVDGRISDGPSNGQPHGGQNSDVQGSTIAVASVSPNAGTPIAQGKLEPNIWTVMQKWILALPADTAVCRERIAVLQAELKSLVASLSHRSGLGKDGLVFAHNDLLSGNIIILPASAEATNGPPVEVTFIDYEYAVPAPAAFDIANHFAEWGGFDCNMNVLPTVEQRRAFIDEYINVYAKLRQLAPHGSEPFHLETEKARMLEEVDVFRGVPGFYWGIWALIQATISDIDFDYATYAEARLSEYWAWKAEVNGERAASGVDMPLRERRWAQENEEDNGGSSVATGSLQTRASTQSTVPI
ncbi:ethanolamine kinase [Sporothrix schenckii 1099-18]|uniref:ethanolamine kinase n=1 Tax=Sporothrix schenckii 1099-18 TaxID=1397361 RepID=A0A0F2M3C0_SPOSC|nr:ethanolamine kinase [Sporothrix schenckii 1099-18]KJR82636.1 ethanolamine kinase [Sporothrix schenckii 1099-18]